MLNFNDSSKDSQVLAVYYAKKIGNDFVIEFMSSMVELKTPEEALLVTSVFWEMVDLSIDDNEKGIAVDGIDDIEFWMHKLFNKVSGYISLQGFEDQWGEATKEAKLS